MTDLIVMSLERWDDVWRRNQHLIAGLLDRDTTLRVLFVEPAVDPLHDLSQRRRPRWPRGLRPGPALPSGPTRRLWLLEGAKWLPRRLAPRVDEGLAGRVVAATRRLGFEFPTLWVNDPDGAAVLEVIDWPTLYDITDDWLLADRPAAETERRARAEELLMERAREVVVCSPTLARTKSERRDVVLVPNAVDVAAYQRPQPRPRDLPADPYALYVGTVHRDRIDISLCVDTARALRGRGRLVVVGPLALSSADRALVERAGVVLLGPRPAAQVPAYLQHAEVLVVPHVVTPFTDSLDPIKRYEYLATGRPVVSTPVAGFRDAGDPMITVVEASAFASAVAERVPDRAPRLQAPVSGVPSWHDRVEQFAEVLDRVSAP
ncbi:MAG TPA: glycosyltransferase [Intrasporangium sp.]|uniref:glycosyltransferase n=1 Tax=Intrasporangium sp. TaxID=1925024 RepID=UPI002F93E9EE